MTPLSRQALRLHGLAIALLTLQLLLSLGLSPLAWGGLALVAMAALKLRESRRPADLQRAALAEFVAVGVLTVLQPELAPSLLQAITALVVLAALLCQESGGRASLRQALLRSLQLGLAALPLLVLLFLLLPRLGPLWSSADAGTGRTGLSGDLDPGSISRLVQDPSPALRISWLQGAVPPPDQRYWRVLVLDRFDGRRWSADPLPPARPQRLTAAAAAAAEQIWVAEPSPLAALPWAGRGLPSTPSLSITADGVLLGPSAGGVRRRYGIGASAEPPTWRSLPPQAIDRALPPGRNPRTEAIGSGWRTLPPLQRVEAARQLFARQGLTYTLTPPALPDAAPLDALLFNTRAGFCEHFASAFTALMRAADLPARVVVGYQGGEWVAASAWGPGYLEVLQRDAHAWSEVWLDGAGWVRVDPTGWVAPERVRAGLSGRAGRLARLLPFWGGIERSWTQLDLSWNRWVLSFDAAQQRSLLGRWRDWQGVLLMIGMGLALVPAVWWLQRSAGAQRLDRQRQRLDRCLALLSPWGLKPEPGESLPQFCERAGQRLPELRSSLSELAESYARLRFAGATGPGARALHRWRGAERELVQRLRRRRPGPVEQAHASPPAPPTP
jgi:transglutaminase-like putative cysteine protease